jgi:anti-anti-sigma factor
MPDDSTPRNRNRQALTASTFVEIVGTLVEDFDVIDVLTRLTSHCVELLGAAAAGILLADGDGHLRVIGASSEQIELLELFLIQNHQGPCLDCYQTGNVVDHANLGDRSPWPQFATESIRAGFPSVCAVPLRLNSATLGCLNLFMAQPVALPAADIALAQALADVASIAITHHRSTHRAGISDDHLHHALTSRIAIEQAKGMIAAHDEGDMHAAFARLRAYAADHNRGLTEIAEALAGGTLAIDSFTPTDNTALADDNPEDSASTAHNPTEQSPQVICVQGELDMATCAVWFDACVATGDRLIVDLSAVTFMDCSAFSAFVAARLELERRGGTLTLRNSTGQPERLLTLITHLDQQERMRAVSRLTRGYPGSTNGVRRDLPPP